MGLNAEAGQSYVVKPFQRWSLALGPYALRQRSHFGSPAGVKSLRLDLSCEVAAYGPHLYI